MSASKRIKTSSDSAARVSQTPLSPPTSATPTHFNYSDGKENWDTTPHKAATTPTTEVPDTNNLDLEGLITDEDELFTAPEPSNETPSKPSQPQTHAGYDAIKSFNGQMYKGMAVGGSHIWNYDPGVWRETKEEPDLWRIDYETTKRRAKNAPDGSGAPVGTEYHWLIVAHQYVRKTDANTYTTHLSGSKYKLAHKNASSTSWSIPTVKAQRDQEVELLDDAKRRVQGLPPVLAAEKVKVERKEKGQQKLDSLFGKAGAGKRKREEEET